MTGEPPLDRSHLADYTGGDRELEREIIGLFLANLPSYLEAFERAGEAEWRSAAHRLKGAARSIGARALAAAAAAAEEADPEERPGLLSMLHDERRRLVDALGSTEI